MRYDKLVRDGIPAKIEAAGETAVTHIADEAEYGMRLRDKLREEMEEFLVSDSNEELADIAEVLEAIYAQKGVARAEIEALRLRKRDERGGFDGRIVLDETRPT